MADTPENIVLEHLRAIRSELAIMRDDLRELRARQVETHTAVLSLRRDQVNDAETPVAAFPASGSIEYDAHWKDLKRAAGCNMDNARIAEKFRAFCAAKGIGLDARNIETVFSSFCAKVGRV